MRVQDRNATMCVRFLGLTFSGFALLSAALVAAAFA